MNLIPKGSEHIERVGKSIDLTNKLLQEIDDKTASIDDNYMVLIPDSNFRKYLKENHSISFDESYVTYNQIKQIIEINTNESFFYNISSLSGLQYFSSLEKLVIPHNEITKLDVSNNSKLSFLDCTGNPLKSIDLSKNLNLTHLVCYYSGLTNIDVLKNVHLQELICGMNRIQHLDISKNTQLSYLNCEANLLSSIEISKNSSLTKFECAQNQLTNINVSANIGLISLDCCDNNLKHLDVTKNINLVELLAERNELLKLDLTQNNYLQKVKLKGNPGDWWIDLEKNPFDFWNSLHGYWKMVMYANKMMNDPKVESGFHLMGYHDYIEYIFSENIDLNKISEIEIIEILNIEYFEFGCRQGNSSGIFAFLPESDPLIIEFRSKYIEITDISPLSYLRKLKKLDLHSSDIIDITALSNLVDLEELNLEGNKINDVSPLRTLCNLEKLNLNNNEIADVSPLSNLQQLWDLNLSNNKISEFTPLLNLDFESILYSIDLSKNFIKDISPLYNLSKDTEIHEDINLSGNPISDKDISDLKEHFTNDIIYFEDPEW